jgi:hypothetical protein
MFAAKLHSDMSHEVAVIRHTARLQVNNHLVFMLQVNSAETYSRAPLSVFLPGVRLSTDLSLQSAVAHA